MSVERVGAEGFRYQDLVTAWIGLQANTLPQATLLPEKIGGEDAELRFTCTSDEKILEIQVKGQQANQVGMDLLSNVLAHFPSRESDGTLLERLISDGRRYLVLVVRQRCNDSVKDFVVDEILPATPNERITNAHVKAVSAELTRVKSNKGRQKTTRLQEQRKEQRRELGGYDQGLLLAALQRVRIVERVKRNDLRENCTLLLRKARIFEDKAADAIRALTEAVTDAKDTHTDAMLGIKQILERLGGPLLLPTGYVVRGSEGDWERTLSTRDVLLLSGHPRCGKSDAARYIAHVFQDYGYEVQVGSRLDTALAFLEDSFAPRRTFILDDPLDNAERVHAELAALERLVQRTSNARKLIVTQSVGTLLEASRKTSLADCTIGRHRWHDLSAPPMEFVRTAWSSIARVQEVPDWLRRRVDHGIASSELTLELGCLRHLASMWEDIPETATLEDMSRTARQEARQLALSIIDRPGMADVLVALAAATTPELSLNEEDLRFILQRHVQDGRPSSRRRVLGVMHSLGANLPAEPQFPEYELLEPLTAEHGSALNFLERRRYIERDRFGNINLPLPFYRAAATDALRGDDRATVEAIRRLLDRALFCLSPRTSRAAARNVSWIRKEVQSIETSDWFLRLADAVKTSMFPATKDNCLAVLMEFEGGNLIEKDEKLIGIRKERWGDCIRAVTANEIDAYRFHDGEAWLVREGIDHRSLLAEFERRKVKIDTKTRKRLAANLADVKMPLPSVQAVVDILKLAEGGVLQISESMAVRLFQYDEGFVRAETARIWTSHSSDPRGVVWQTLCRDKHPAVILGALDGVVVGWPAYADDVKRALLEALSGMLASPLSRVVYAGHLLDIFAPSEYQNNEAPSKIFSVLFSGLLENFSPSGWLDESKLYGAVEIVVDTSPVSEAFVLLDAWSTYLERRTSAKLLPTDSGLAIARLILDATRNKPDLREGRIARLLAVKGTSAVARTLRDLLRRWSELTDAEQAAIADLLRRRRKDAKWLLAVAVTQPNLNEYQKILPGHLSSLAGTSAIEALRSMGATLADAALRTYCGAPTILSHVGLSDTGSQLWEDILLHVATLPGHRRFSLAVQKVFTSMRSEAALTLIRSAKREHVLVYFSAFLATAVVESWWRDEDIWAALLEKCVDAGVIAQSLLKMCDVANAVIDRWSEFEGWIPQKQYREIVEGQMQEDFVGHAVYVLHEQCLRGKISEKVFFEKVEQIRPYLKADQFKLAFTPRNLEVVSERFQQLFDEGAVAAFKERTSELEAARSELRRVVNGDDACEAWVAP
ncbi:hypothetical protein [Paraburkholderia terrae]|nr:hypothetical protein [Paraburkholderia terrae]